MTLPRMLVIIVNYRTPALVVDCLASLAGDIDALPGIRVTVVDNASGDGSEAMIAQAIDARGWNDWADVVASPINGGFSHGNNLILRAALAGNDPPDLYWLLNPDTRVEPGSAVALLSFLADHPKIGIAGTALIEENGRPWPYAFRFHSVLSELERGARLGPVSRLLAQHAVLWQMDEVAQPVDWVSGASIIVRRNVFDAVGLLDENYFLYYEETDFCLRARRAGWLSWYVPHAAVVHIAGQSTGITGHQPVPKRMPRYWFDSRRRYFVKNHGRAYAMLADLVWVTAHAGWRVRRWASRRPDPDPPALIRDFLRNSSLAPRRRARP